MNYLLENIIAVEVGEGFYGYKVARAKDGEQFLILTDRVGDTEIVTSLKAYPGNWQFLFCTGDASEEQAQMIMGDGDGDYLDYVSGFATTSTAKLSLQSLLSSKGLKQNYALLKKIN